MSLDSDKCCLESSEQEIVAATKRFMCRARANLLVAGVIFERRDSGGGNDRVLVQ